MNFSTTYEKDNPSLLAQLKEANKYQPWIDEAAEKYHLQPCVIAGIGSRESHWGLALKPEGPEGTGDFGARPIRPPTRTSSLPPDGLGYGRGLMQIDFDWHEFAQYGEWRNPRENILYGCSVMTDCFEFIKSRLDQSLPGRETLRAVLAAYNTGSARTLKAIKEGVDVDTNTSGHNYSVDVLNRAGWWQLHGWA